jgi:hypothetical protein
MPVTLVLDAVVLVRWEFRGWSRDLLFLSCSDPLRTPTYLSWAQTPPCFIALMHNLINAAGILSLRS